MEDVVITATAKEFYCPGFSGSQEAVLIGTTTIRDKGPWREAENSCLDNHLSGNL